VELNHASGGQMRGLMAKFFPDATLEQLHAFSDQLPEFKLSMAKLQGHFLKHRDDIEAVVSRAKELLDVEEQVKEMSINQWLRRLNLPQFAHKFRKDKEVCTVKDLRQVGEGDLVEMGMTLLTDRKRVIEMMNGDQDTKLMFRM